MNAWEKLLNNARGRSPWIYCLNTGACNGCDIEIAASLTPRYDAEQLGVRREGSPKHADILVVSGPVTLRTRDALLDIYQQMPHPKAVVAVGSCPASGNVFAGSPTVFGAVDQFIPVDVYVAGCPPRPQAILQGIAQAAQLLAAGKQKDHVEVIE
ncbi:MAG: NADH-quinone oxidoreductase subunit NuoB [Chloroflexi bacterium]|jgi:membrane-bound hydrogenase subunit mbhJ|nr:NADH-quinone oxidoreductase subunit NuoB [Anaerolineaceae bacterium]NMB88443.1 NADH-quinone oxidoreductase subunit NuoB [Chloroflexota bacterium]